MPLPITVKATEMFDEKTNKFINIEETHLLLEHSLVSLREWEAKWKVPFLDQKSFTKEGQIIDYFKFMTLNKEPIDDMVYYAISNEDKIRIMRYIQEKRTATWFDKTSEIYGNKNIPKKEKHEIITAEMLYWEMITLNIPMECQYWHVSSLLTLIETVNRKNNENQPKYDKKGRHIKQKGASKDYLAMRAKINEERKAKLGTTG